MVFLMLKLERDKEESSPSIEYLNMEIPFLHNNRSILNVPQEELYHETPKSTPYLKAFSFPEFCLINLQTYQ